MFVTYILKIINSTYLSGTFQIRDVCFKAGLPCLCLCTSLGLFVFTSDMGPSSASLIATTTAVAHWIATLVTLDRIASAYAISA